MIFVDSRKYRASGYFLTVWKHFYRKSIVQKIFNIGAQFREKNRKNIQLPFQKH